MAHTQCCASHQARGVALGGWVGIMLPLILTDLNRDYIISGTIIPIKDC